MRSIAAAPHIFWAILFIVLPLIIVVYYAFTDADGNAFYVVMNKWWDKQAEDYQIDTYELDIEVEDEE